MQIAPQKSRLLLSTVAAVLLALTLGTPKAHALGRSNVSSALQIGVQVVRSCAVDSSARTAGPVQAAREALVLATQASLSASCAATQIRVSVLPVQVSLVESLGTVERLDVEF